MWRVLRPAPAAAAVAVVAAVVVAVVAVVVAVVAAVVVAVVAAVVAVVVAVVVVLAAQHALVPGYWVPLLLGLLSPPRMYLAPLKDNWLLNDQ